jgi:putative membrane-bound dehydrogenase-like protein
LCLAAFAVSFSFAGDRMACLADEDETFPPAKPRQASLAAFQERKGVDIELIASEPDVVDPVAFDWGPDGRLWVAEMRDYPNGISWHKQGDPLGAAGGRIKLLEELDRDGHFDKVHVFLDKIPCPTGVKAWRKGVLVTAAPDIVYAEDTDGDARADKREVFYTGFTEGNQQHRINGERWGLDQWLYLANGGSGGTVKSLTTSDEVEIGGRDLRIKPDQGLVETESGQTQNGRIRDDHGNWFGASSSNPVWHFVLEDRYLARNPQSALRAAARTSRDFRNLRRGSDLSGQLHAGSIQRL